MNLQRDFIFSEKAFMLGEWGAEITIHSDNSLI